MNFKNQNILISGGSRGIGRATAIRFAELGGNVIINFKEDKQAAASCLDILSEGNHWAFQADLSRPDEIQKMVKEVTIKYQNIDVLVNNAGIYKEQPLEDVEFDEWQKQWKLTLDTNLIGLANLTFLVAKQMIARNGGSIVNVSSRGAFRGEPDHPAYGASKAAVNSFSQSMAQKLGKHNISVTAVAPGFVATDMAKSILESQEGKRIKQQSPFGRVAKPEEVAETIVFLASKKAHYLSGGIVDVNGASFLRM